MIYSKSSLISSFFIIATALSSFVIIVTLSPGYIFSLSLASFGITICHFGPIVVVPYNFILQFLFFIFLKSKKSKKSYTSIKNFLKNARKSRINIIRT